MRRPSLRDLWTAYTNVVSAVGADVPSTPGTESNLNLHESLYSRDLSCMYHLCFFNIF